MEVNQVIIISGLLAFVIGILIFYFVKDRRKEEVLVDEKGDEKVESENVVEKENEVSEVVGGDNNATAEAPSSTSKSVTSTEKTPTKSPKVQKESIDIRKTMLTTPPKSYTPIISTPTTAGTTGTSGRSCSAMKVNTKFDVDEFTLRLFKVPFLVYRIKGKESKLRCIRINEACEVCLYKSFTENESAVYVTGAPYIKIPIRTLKACFPCEEGNGRFFILEFHGRTLHLASSTLLDANYLISGFSNLASRVKYDKVFLDIWEDKFTHGTYPKTPKKSRK